MDRFATAERAMIAQVPVNAGVRTAYAQMGDWFAWLGVAALALLIVRGFVW